MRKRTCQLALWAASAAIVWGGALTANAQTQTLRFQEGIDGFASVRDSFLQTGSPDQNNDFLNHFENKIWETEWDGSDAGGRNLAMFWFEDIFGDGPNQIPLGSTIVSAEFESMIINDGSRSNLSFVYRLTKEWDETTVTMNSYFDTVDAAAFGQAPDNFEEDMGPSLIEASGFVATETVLTVNHIPNLAGSAFSADLSPIVQEWSDGETNYGFIIMVVQGSNGFGHIASEARQINRALIDDLIAQGMDVADDIEDPAFAGFDVNIAPTLVVSTPDGEFTFQYGTDGFMSYQDAWISAEGVGTEPDGGVNNLWNFPLGGEGVIRANISDTGISDFGLVRFDNIIGEGEGQIPPGTQIDSAVIRFFVADDTSEPVSVHQIKPFESVSFDDPEISINTNWDEKTVTFANFVEDGIGPVFGNEITEDSPVGEFNASSEFRLAEAEVTASIQAFSDGTAENLGWLFEGNDVHFVGKEGAEVFGGPALVVEFMPPEGTAIKEFSIY